MMIDWYGEKKAGKWIRQDKTQLMAMMFALPFVIAPVIILLYMVFQSLSIIFPLMVMPVVIFFAVFSIVLYLQIKDMFTKTFNIDHKIVLDIIEQLLKSKGIMYTKQSEGGTLPQFPAKIIEIFDLSEKGVSIKIQQPTSLGTNVMIGPVRDDNENEIEALKNELDNAFLPKGL